jgi:hypothetical protein
LDHVFEINEGFWNKSSHEKTQMPVPGHGYLFSDAHCHDCEEINCVTCDNEPHCKECDENNCALCETDSSCNDCDEIICIICDNEPCNQYQL